MQACLMQRSDIEVMLERGSVNILFEKKDGTMRRMVATTNLGMIPKENHPVGFGGRRSDTAKPVFDLEANAWRSFRWDSLLEIE